MSEVKRIFGAITLVMLVSLVVLLPCITGLEGMAVRAEAAAEAEEGQLTEEIDRDAEFSAEGIIVVLDEEASRTGDGDAASLDRIGHGDVVDLTKISEPSDGLTEYYQEHAFHRILSVELTDKTEDGV